MPWLPGPADPEVVSSEMYYQRAAGGDDVERIKLRPILRTPQVLFVLEREDA